MREMDDELLELLASVDVLEHLDGPLLLPEALLQPANSLELSLDAPLSPDASETAISKRDADIERKREYRRRKKAEADNLRAQLKQLEAQLEGLLIQAKQSKCSDTMGWKAVAQRQLQRRLEVIALNKQLKARVRFYHEAALRLIEVLPGVIGNSPFEMALATPSVTVNSWDVEMMHCLARETQEMRREVDGIIAGCPPIYLSAGSSYAAEQSWNRDGVVGHEVFELSEVVAMPFVLQDVLKAHHHALIDSYSEECKPVVISDPNDTTTVIAKVHFSSSVGENESTLYESVFTSRAFVEDSRAVFAWRSVIREGGSQESWQRTVHADLSCWGIAVQRAGGGILLSSHSRLQLRNYKPPTAGGGPQDEALRLYVERFSYLAEDDAHDFLWRIENVIMDSKSRVGCVS